MLMLPLAAYAAFFLLTRRAYSSLREAGLVAAAWWTFALVLLTETLSLARAITPRPLAVSWLCLLLAVVAVAITQEWKLASSAKSDGAERPPSFRVRLGGLDRLMLWGGILIIGLVGLTAAISPPNGSDQLQYHLPRIVEWAGRHSVAFFPTHYYVQLFAPPLAEWMMLHSYVLANGDRFVCLVQWLAYTGSAVTVSLVARELGADRRGQIFAALLCITLPQGILAASGAKNDWVLACSMAAVLFFLLRWFRSPGWLATCNLGIVTGAALLSKGSVYAFLPPVVLAVCALGLRSHSKFAWQRVPIVIGLILVMNGFQWGRNYSLGGSIFGLPAPDVAGKDRYGVDHISLPGIASNVLRETAMHLGTPLDAVNSRETTFFRFLITSMGVDPDDRALTNYGSFEIPRQYYSRDEYYAGNPLHLLLVVVSFALLLVHRRGNLAGATAIASGITGGFVLYCALFKWEIWCARLHLPLFVAASAVVAVVFSQRFPRLVPLIAAAAIFFAIPPALLNQSRPLLFSGGFHQALQGRTSIFLQGRDELYFTQQRSLRETYLAASAVIRSGKCDDIGMDTSIRPYSHEYPLMELSRNPDQDVKFRYVNVHNLSAKYADQSDHVVPCTVLCLACRDSKGKRDEYSSAFPVSDVFGDLVVFRQTPSVPAALAGQRN